MSSRMNFATIIGTITPLISGFNPITFTSETTWDEIEILTEPQIAKPRGKRFMSRDGVNSQTIHNYAKNGMRDLNLFDIAAGEKLIKYAENNPTVHFDFDFRYQKQEQDSASVRIQRHKDCFIENQPGRAISNDVAIIRFTINYGLFQNINAVTGAVVG